MSALRGPVPSRAFGGFIGCERHARSFPPRAPKRNEAAQHHTYVNNTSGRSRTPPARAGRRRPTRPGDSRESGSRNSAGRTRVRRPGRGGRPTAVRVQGRARGGRPLRYSTLTPACSRPKPRAPCAFEDSMVHVGLQFTTHIAFRGVLHRPGSLAIHRRKFVSVPSIAFNMPLQRERRGTRGGHSCERGRENGARSLSQTENAARPRRPRIGE